MIANGQNGIVTKQGLGTEELTQIGQLADICNRHDGIELKLNWEMLRSRLDWETNDFLYYHEGQLIGFLGLYMPNKREIEVSGMVHPDYRRKGIFRSLFTRGSEEIRRREPERVIFSVNHVALSGQNFAEAFCARYSFTEYEMALGEVTPLQKKHRGLSVEYAAADDAEFFSGCMETCFSLTEEETRDVFIEAMTTINRQLYKVCLDGQPIGMIGAVFGGSHVTVHHLAILPEYRGRGYAGQAFAETVHKLLDDGHPVQFQVRCHKERSLAIYTACGFQVASAYDYYEFAVPAAGE